MIPPTPSLLIATAQAFVGERRDGVFARQFLDEVWAGPGAETVLHWDTAFVHHMGYWSHSNVKGTRSSWPLAPSATCDELFALADAHGVVREEPLAGDLFLLRSSLRAAFFRSGIVVDVPQELHVDHDGTRYRECITIEGDSDQTMARFGGQVLRHRRRLSAERGDRFVRWTAMDWRARRVSQAMRPADTHMLKAA